ncbi:MAG: type IV pilus assembly protein PilE [Lysobacterales bacterium]|jgi:type IV pilus assembly protein PilE
MARLWKGFSLIELVIAMAILAILITMATPAMHGFSMRSHRTVAISELLRLASCQEHIRADAGLYNTSMCLPTNDEHYHFGYEIPGLSATSSFIAIATPQGAQLKDKCGSLMLDQDGQREIENIEVGTGKCWASR